VVSSDSLSFILLSYEGSRKQNPDDPELADGRDIHMEYSSD
jgi:hypothetical protein